MHEYEFDIDSGKLTNMKSWKKSDTLESTSSIDKTKDDEYVTIHY